MRLLLAFCIGFTGINFWLLKIVKRVTNPVPVVTYGLRTARGDAEPTLNADLEAERDSERD